MPELYIILNEPKIQEMIWNQKVNFFSIFKDKNMDWKD